MPNAQCKVLPVDIRVRKLLTNNLLILILTGTVWQRLRNDKELIEIVAGVRH